MSNEINSIMAVNSVKNMSTFHKYNIFVLLNLRVKVKTSPKQPTLL